MLNTKQLAAVLGIFSLFSSFSTPVLSQERTSETSFKNDSNNTLRCDIFNKNRFVPFLILEGKDQKTFNEFVLNSRVRCHIILTQNSSTYLTYFNVSSVGTYELTLEKLPCKTCTQIGRTWRWGTVVIPPNGQADYNGFGQE